MDVDRTDNEKLLRITDFLFLALPRLFAIYRCLLDAGADFSKENVRKLFIHSIEEDLHRIVEEFLSKYLENTAHVGTSQHGNRDIKYWSSKGVESFLTFIKYDLGHYWNCDEGQSGDWEKDVKKVLFESFDAFGIAFELAG
jgi:hypothetical protein